MARLNFTVDDSIAMIRAVVLLLWPISGYCASESLGTTLGAITFADWLSLVMLSGVSGLVALLHRVRRNLEAAALDEVGKESNQGDRQLISWKVFAVAHMTGAMFVGAMSFLLCEALGDAFQMNNYLEAAVIALCSWSGAKVADKWADQVSEGMLNRIGNLFGKRRDE